MIDQNVGNGNGALASVLASVLEVRNSGLLGAIGIIVARGADVPGIYVASVEHCGARGIVSVSATRGPFLLLSDSH